MTKLSGKGFEDTLKNPVIGAIASSEVAKLTKTIRAEKPIAGVSRGDASVAYDVILQPGHYGRKKGATGASGAKISERALNAHIVRQIAEQLAGKGLKVLVVPADGVQKGLKAKIFLAIHSDGSPKSCSTGPSLGYEDSHDVLSMHAIGAGLAHAFGYDYADFRKDNFTVNESKYYMFHRVNTTMLKGLLEVGEVTCARSEAKLISSSREISSNVAAALFFVTQLQAGQ
jgi:N-acetylmuramoyl-L-alanine amidase